MNDLSKLLPPDLERWIESQVAEGRYFDAGDYLRDLIRRDRARVEDTEWVRAMIEEGEASGLSDEDPFELIDRLIAETRAN